VDRGLCAPKIKLADLIFLPDFKGRIAFDIEPAFFFSFLAVDFASNFVPVEAGVWFFVLPWRMETGGFFIEDLGSSVSATLEGLLSGAETLSATAEAYLSSALVGAVVGSEAWGTRGTALGVFAVVALEVSFAPTDFAFPTTAVTAATEAAFVFELTLALALVAFCPGRKAGLFRFLLPVLLLGAIINEDSGSPFGGAMIDVLAVTAALDS